MKYRLPKYVSVTGGILIGCCLICLSGYVARGWLRQTVAPFYVKTVYMPALHGHFQKDFDPINQTLASFGYRFAKSDYDGCDTPEFQGFGESFFCLRGSTSNKLTPNSKLIQAWEQRSSRLEQQLLTSGWSKDNIHQPITTLLDDTDVHDTSQPTINYRRYHGKIECDFSIRNSPSSHETYATESCQRQVDLFGGY